MSTPDPARAPRDYSSIRRVLAGVMMAGGALLFLICGATVTAVSMQEPAWAWVAIFVGMFGLVPGAALVIIGRVLWRQ